MGSKVAIQALNPYLGKYAITGEIKHENNWLAILEINRVQKRIDIKGFATHRIYIWGQKCGNLARSLHTPCPDRAYGPRNKHYGPLWAAAQRADVL